MLTLPVGAENGSEFKLKSLPSVYFVACLTNHLSTVSIDSSYSMLKVISKPFDINQKRLPFKTIKVGTNSINLIGIP